MYWEVYAQQMQGGGRGRPVVQCSPKPDRILVAMALYTLAQSNLVAQRNGLVNTKYAHDPQNILQLTFPVKAW